jgi:hypothetical protein
MKSQGMCIAFSSCILLLACASDTVAPDGDAAGPDRAAVDGGDEASTPTEDSTDGSDTGAAGGTDGGAIAPRGDGGTGASDGSATADGSAGRDSGATGGAADGGSGAPGGTGTGGATIINNTFWKDTSGTPIYSQGGGVLQVGDTYYWYGVKYRGAVAYVSSQVDNDDIAFQGITTYSSKDLVHWKHEATDMPANTGGWFGRLGVAYNANTKKYVLVAQGGGGLYFATSDKPSGGFAFSRVQMNPPGIANGSTGDQTIFQDDDGQAYLVSSSSSGRANRYVSPLRATDFLEAENAVLVYKGGGREGNCMFKYDGRYYFCSSDLHGWNSSQSYCVSASNIRGPWSAEFVLEGTQNDYSHVTQTGFFIAVKGSEQTTIVFAGDRWANFAGNGIGFNQWMPLSFNGNTPHFHSLSAWTLNATSGRWSVASQNNWVLNPSFEADRISVTTPVGWKATNGTNPNNDRHTGNRSWQLNGTASLSQTIDELPKGTYTLSVWAKSSGQGAQLSVKNYGGADKMAAIPAATSWMRVTLAGIEVNNGKADVGVASAGPTVKLDDFEMVLAP